MDNVPQVVKIVRLQSGEDIIAGYVEDYETELITLDNPMHLIFKRTIKGTVMMLLPWLPIEIIKNNSASIFSTDILTTYDPKDDLIAYYDKIINHPQMKEMSEYSKSYSNYFDELEDGYEEEEDESMEMSMEETTDMLIKKKNNRLH
jgi:hypothetical protein